jgi:formylglycine-generating enzyme required for sulfatase activity
MRYDMVCVTAAVISLLTGCGIDVGVGTGGNQSSDLTAGGANGIGILTAPYLILDLDHATIDTRSEIPTLLSDSQYRTNMLVFHRITPVTGTPLLIAVFETTQGQWSRIAPATTQPWMTASVATVGSAAIAVDRPAFNLAYATVDQALTNWNNTHQMQLQLPTAEQWQTAAAGGTTTTYWWGDQADRATLLTRAVVAEVTDGVKGPRQVGSLAPNPFGLYDTSGNVWEWIAGGKQLRGGSWSDGVAAAATTSVLDTSAAGITDVTEHVLAGARLVLVP